MSQEEILKKMINEITDEEITTLLEVSKGIILNARYPYADISTKHVEDRYLNLQIRMCIELYNRQGSEGELSRDENGIARRYESASVSNSLLNEITPYCGMF